MEFSKGHGTENDFVILPDPDARLDLAPERIAALCDRRRGLGADGVLRVARTGALVSAGVLPELPEGTGADDWFMDYRNADGSIAEMCGNGVRVFAHYLTAHGLETGRDFVVGSRAGGKPVQVHATGPVFGEVTVDMGLVRQLGTSTATLDGRFYSGIGIDVGNPHLACVDPALTEGTELSGIRSSGPDVRAMSELLTTLVRDPRPVLEASARACEAAREFDPVLHVARITDAYAETESL
jgi:diaminopimelate epimerase